MSKIIFLNTEAKKNITRDTNVLYPSKQNNPNIMQLNEFVKTVYIAKLATFVASVL